MDRAKLVDYFLTKIHDKDFEIYQVRQELEKHNIDEEEIKVIIRIVDNAHQKISLTKAGNSKANELIWIDRDNRECRHYDDNLSRDNKYGQLLFGCVWPIFWWTWYFVYRVSKEKKKLINTFHHYDLYTITRMSTPTKWPAARNQFNLI